MEEDFLEATAKRNHYVNNKELYEVMKIYHEKYLETKSSGKERPPMPDLVAAAITQISTKMMRMHNFCSYSYKNEMTQDAVLQLTAKFHLFDPAKSENVFGWFSQICWNCAIGRIKQEQKQSSIRSRMINEKFTTDFIQQNLEKDIDGNNAFVEFLKENEIFIDYYEKNKSTEKTGNLHPSLKHRNLTPYVKKTKEVVIIEDPETDLFALTE